MILYAKYEKTDLHTVKSVADSPMTITQRNKFLQLLQKDEDLFDKTLGIWKTYPVEFRWKENAKPICLRLYPVPEVHKEIFKKEV